MTQYLYITLKEETFKVILLGIYYKSTYNIN